jgi:integration host factor subunit beta
MATTTNADSKTITKKELIDRIAAATEQKRHVVKDTIQAFLNEVVEEIGRGNRLEFRDFGVFEIRERAQRMAQNPKTMQKVIVPAKRTVKFKIGREMRERLEKDSVGSPGRSARTKSNGTLEVKTRSRAKVGV